MNSVQITLVGEELEALEALLGRAIDEVMLDLSEDSPEYRTRLRIRIWADRLRWVSTFANAVGLESVEKNAITTAEAYEEELHFGREIQK